MAGTGSVLDSLDFADVPLSRSPQYRASYCRLKAVQLRGLAAWEPLLRLRDQLLARADEYDRQAAELETRSGMTRDTLEESRRRQPYLA